MFCVVWLEILQQQFLKIYSLIAANIVLSFFETLDEINYVEMYYWEKIENSSEPEGCVRIPSGIATRH